MDALEAIYRGSISFLERLLYREHHYGSKVWYEVWCGQYKRTWHRALWRSGRLHQNPVSALSCHCCSAGTMISCTLWHWVVWKCHALGIISISFVQSSITQWESSVFEIFVAKTGRLVVSFPETPLNELFGSCGTTQSSISSTVISFKYCQWLPWGDMTYRSSSLFSSRIASVSCGFEARRIVCRDVSSTLALCRTLLLESLAWIHRTSRTDESVTSWPATSSLQQ